LWEQFQNPIEKYHTVGTIPKSNRKIPHCGNNSKIQWKNTTLSEQFQNTIEKYHTVGTIPKSNRKILHCGNNSKIQ
jgi:uncharacterized 2Fe-2S/4Fe-4S cluster protein (DUF4445 family)